MARRGVMVTRGLRRLTRDPVTLNESRRVVASEVANRGDRLLASFDRLVWPFPDSPIRRLLDHAGVEAGDVRRLVADQGVDEALLTLCDQGVYVSYEEYHGRVEARRGRASFRFSPPDFFNPLVRADYLATTGGSRSQGTPVELSFAWQRRQGAQRPIQYDMAAVGDGPTAVWLPVFPSAAGFGAVMKNTVGGRRPQRWFSQVAIAQAGITLHKQVANRFLPVLSALARADLPSPEHVPTDRPEKVVRWLQEALATSGSAALTGYASSLTSAARYAVERGIDLTGVVAFPSSEPVTVGKLEAMRAAGIRPYPMYAFVPEGTMGLHCDECADEEYHLWEQDMVVVPRVRPRGDGSDVTAFCWTSLAEQAPRVLVNVENDDYGTIRRDVACSCPLGALGLTTRLAGIRGISKVVTAGISLEGETFDELAEVVLPRRLGGGPGDYQFVEQDSPSGAVVALRIHPRTGPVDEDAAMAGIREALATTDNGVLAGSLWGRAGGLRILREAPAVTGAGKTLSFERIGAPAPTATSSS